MEIVVLLANLRAFLKLDEQASKATQIPLPRHKIKVGSTLSKDNLFAQCYENIREFSNSQIRLPYRFEQNNKCFFSIKKFKFDGDQLILAEIVYNNHHETQRVCKNRCLNGYKCGFCESNYDI